MRLWKPCPAAPAICPARSRWGSVLLVAALLTQLVLLAGYARFFSTPGVGFTFVGVDVERGLWLTVPVTSAARGGYAPRPGLIEIREINGHTLAEVPAGTGYGSALRGVLDFTPGATNTFVVERNGAPETLALPTAVPELSAWLSHPHCYFQLLAWLYLACGALVWWRRQADRSALPLLFFTAIASLQMSVPAATVWLDSPFEALKTALIPLYAVTGLDVTLAFTGFHVRPRARLVRNVVLVSSIATASALAFGTLLLLHAHVGVRPWLDAAQVAAGVHLLISVVIMVGVCWAAAQPAYPLGLRRRARVMGAALVLAFVVPSSYLGVAPFLPAEAHGVMGIVVLVLMGTYPLMLVYAIVRHQLFDLRIVVRQGVVYGALSLLVTLAYLGVVVGVVRGLGRHAESPFVMGLAAVVLVVLASLLKLKVQNAVDRVVFRARYVYADAVATASEQLSRTRSVDAITDTVRAALIDAMQLSRAYFAVRDGHESAALRCFMLGNKPEPRSGRLPPELPGALDPERLAPVARALDTRRVATAYDSAAASAQVAADRAAPSTAHEHGEDTFWVHFGIEAVVPLTSGDGGAQRVVGLLLLGPKLSEHQLDPEDQQLLSTLANQLAVALDNAAAFEEIERLKAGLQAEVEQRTSELSAALVSLSQTQSELLESQKQAMLGRLMAGIVHEVNSPLGALASSADTIRKSFARARGYMAERPADDAAASQALRAIDRGEELTHVIRTGSSRIGALMTSLSSFVSLDQAEYKTFDVRQGIESTLLLIGPQLDGGLRVDCRLPEEPVLVRAHAAKLNQVFLNLIENAITATQGQGQLSVQVRRSDTEVEIVVADDGCGMRPDQLLRVFDFTFTTKVGGRIGLGLGLPTSKRTVEEHGGALAIESEIGRGTRVRITLPIASPTSSQPPPPN